MTKIYNISVPKKINQNGVEKTFWNNVGKLIKFEASETKPEGYRLELSMFPDTKFGVFEQKNQQQNTNSQPLSKENINFHKNEDKINEEVNIEDIPF